MTDEKEAKVFLAVLSRDSIVCAPLALHMCGWVNNRDQSRIANVTIVQNRRTLESARNQGVKWFLDSDCTHLMFCDHDIVPPIDTPQLLLEADKDVVSPLCLMVRFEDRRMHVFSQSSRIDAVTGDYSFVSGGDLERVDVAAGGSMLIKRHVLETLGTYAFKATHTRDGTGLLFNADFGFAQNCEKHDFEHWTDFRIVCDHIRPIGLESTLNGVMSRQPASYSEATNV